MKSKVLEMQGRVLIQKCWIANTFVSRLRGLMGKTGLEENEAVLFPNCNSVHTCFMRFTIDVVMVGEDGVVIHVAHQMKPWKLLAPRRGARHIIEMQAGLAKKLGIGQGQQLRCNGVLT